MDESGFQCGIGGHDNVICKRNDPRPNLPNDFARDLVTVIETISAKGTYIRPTVILPGSVILHQWARTEYCEKGVGDLAVSEHGYNTDQIMFEYLKRFERETRYRSPGAWRLLLLDGFEGHKTKELVDFTENHKIILFFFPPHLTHLMQPLDVAVFGPMKHWHGQSVNRAARAGNTRFGKIEFLDRLPGIREKTLRESTIRSAFADTGIWPFNPMVVLNRVPEIEDLERPRTPETDTESIEMKTPRKWVDFQQWGDQIAATLRDTGMVEWGAVVKLMKGAKIAFVEKDLYQKELAECRSEQQRNEYLKRRVGDLRRIQVGGTIEAADLRKIASERDIEDETKAQRPKRTRQTRTKQAVPGENNQSGARTGPQTRDNAIEFVIYQPGEAVGAIK